MHEVRGIGKEVTVMVAGKLLLDSQEKGMKYVVEEKRQLKKWRYC